MQQPKLFQLCSCARFFQLSFSRIGVFFRNTFFDRLGCAFDQVFGFFQAQTSDFANRLDHVHFLFAERSQHYVKVGFLLSGTASVTASRTSDYSSRSEEHTSELQSRGHIVCRLLLEKKKNKTDTE